MAGPCSSLISSAPYAGELLPSVIQGRTVLDGAVLRCSRQTASSGDTRRGAAEQMGKCEAWGR
jgi:hypothetical protein